MKWLGGEGVFIGPKSRGRPVLRAYVWCYCITVQTVFRMTRYYPVDSVNSATYVHYTVHRVRLYYQSKHTSGGGLLYVRTTDNGIHPVFQHTSTLKDKSVRPPTLAYVRSRRPISQNALLTDPSDPKFKLILVTKLLMPS